MGVCESCGKKTSKKYVRCHSCANRQRAGTYHSHLHQSKGNNPNWKGGMIINKGRYMVRMPDHPAATKKGYIYLHRLIMEAHLGRYLTKTEYVHHKDGNRMNNSLDNLQLITPSEHTIHHNRQRKITRDKQGRPDMG